MPSTLRIGVGACAVLGLLAALFFLRPSWLARLGLDPDRALNDVDALNRAVQRAEALDSWGDSIWRRIRVKDAVVQDLIAHRLTLLQAGARIKTLVEEGSTRYQATFRRLNHGGSDEERACRHLIECVRDVLGTSDPSRAESEATDLEAQLVTHLEEGTLTFSLPGDG